MREDVNQPDLQPVYNIKAVARLVNLLPVTLRAWERRYGLPSPLRGDQGYRLYSEYDLRTLRWLINQVEAGLSIGRAAQPVSFGFTQRRSRSSRVNSILLTLSSIHTAKHLPSA